MVLQLNILAVIGAVACVPNAALAATDSGDVPTNQSFGAGAPVRCAQERGEKLGECPAEVEGTDDGRTTVTVEFPSGFRRQLTFIGDRFVRGDASMSGVGTDTDWTREDGKHLIRVDDQRFVIPEALIPRE